MEPRSEEKSNHKSESENQLNNSLIIEKLQEERKRFTFKVDDFIESLLEKISINDPITANNKKLQILLKQNVQLKKLNGNLFQQIRSLKKQVNRQKKVIEKLKSTGSPASNQNAIDTQQREQSEQSRNSMSQTLVKIGLQIQNQHIEKIDQMVNHARMISKKDVENIDLLSHFIHDVLQKLIKRFEIVDINSKSIEEKDKDFLMLVNRQAYQHLLEFYCEAMTKTSYRIFQKNKLEQLKEPQLEYLSTIQMQMPEQLLKTHDVLQQYFADLTKKIGVEKQWNKYLKTSTQQAQSFKTAVMKVLNGQQPQINKNQIRENSKIIKENNSLLQSAKKSQQTTEDSILQVKEQAQNQIEDILFRKIQSLIKLDKLGFSTQQFKLFQQFDRKRKAGRMFDIHQVLNKFKNKDDVFQLSHQWNMSLIKTVNFIMMKTMHTLTDWNNPETIDIFSKRLNELSGKLKPTLQKTISSQCDSYLKQKYAESKKSMNCLNDFKFDKQKKLQKECIQMAEQYAQVIEQSLFFCNRKINLSLT